MDNYLYEPGFPPVNVCNKELDLFNLIILVSLLRLGLLSQCFALRRRLRKCVVHSRMPRRKRIFALSEQKPSQQQNKTVQSKQV